MHPVKPNIEGMPAGVVLYEVIYAKNQPQYLQLPVFTTSEGVVVSEWELTIEEREAIARGVNLKLVVHTFNEPLQPVRLVVGALEAEDLRA